MQHVILTRHVALNNAQVGKKLKKICPILLYIKVGEPKNTRAVKFKLLTKYWFLILCC